MLDSDIRTKYMQGIRNFSHERPCSLCIQTDFDFSILPHFHGSDFGKCLRAVQVEKYQPAPDPVPVEKQAQFADGHVHEAAIVRTLMSGGVLINHLPGMLGDEGCEFFVTIDLRTGKKKSISFQDASRMQSDSSSWLSEKILAAGHVDGVIDDTYLLECKAVKDWAFKSKIDVKRPPENYLMQMRFYMMGLDLLSGFLVVKNRDTSEIKIANVQRDDAAVIEKAFDLQKIVDRRFTRDPLPCVPVWPDEKKFCNACKH